MNNIDPHPLTADKGQILLSEKLLVPPISLFLISNINLVYEKCPDYEYWIGASPFNLQMEYH